MPDGFSERARHRLEALRGTTPTSLPSKTLQAVVNTNDDLLVELMAAGYSSEALAAAMSEDEYGVVPATLETCMSRHRSRRPTDAPEAFVTIDLPAGDTATMRRCTEIIVGTCRGLGIRLVVVVSAVAVDPIGREVLEALVPLLEDCDRSVLAKNTILGVNFDYLDATAVAQRLESLSTHRVVEIEKVGVCLIEALRLHNWT